MVPSTYSRTTAPEPGTKVAELECAASLLSTVHEKTCTGVSLPYITAPWFPAVDEGMIRDGVGFAAFAHGKALEAGAI